MTIQPEPQPAPPAPGRAPGWHELYHDSHSPGASTEVLSGWLPGAVECVSCRTLLYSDRGPATGPRAYRPCEGRPGFDAAA